MGTAGVLPDRYTVLVDPDSARRWIEARRAAARREAREAREAGPHAASAIASALALVALTGQLHGWPVPESATDRREDELVRERWARLRARLRPDAAPR
jgi:hypothetical protein